MNPMSLPPCGFYAPLPYMPLFLAKNVPEWTYGSPTLCISAGNNQSCIWATSGSSKFSAKLRSFSCSNQHCLNPEWSQSVRLPYTKLETHFLFRNVQPWESSFIWVFSLKAEAVEIVVMDFHRLADFGKLRDFNPFGL